MTEEQTYPHLFQPTRWGNAEVQFQREWPDARLIANVSVVPFIGTSCVLIRLDNGSWEVPGGTLEPGETVDAALKRELLEEAGAIAHDFYSFGAWSRLSRDPVPYRPHIPHPLCYRLVGYSEIELVSVPQIPDDGENVVAVECMSIEQAGRCFSQIGRRDLAELYQLAAAIRASRP